MLISIESFVYLIPLLMVNCILQNMQCAIAVRLALGIIKKIQVVMLYFNIQS